MEIFLLYQLELPVTKSLIAHTTHCSGTLLAWVCLKMVTPQIAISMMF
jgi:hypothetical protein